MMRIGFKSGTPTKLARTRRNFKTAAALLCGVFTSFGHVAASGAATVEAPIIPTVHPTLLPSSAITSPLIMQADNITVWKPNDEQRVLLSGHISISLGYRVLTADRAAVFLTPSKEAGDSTFDVAVYLLDNVRVEEKWRKGTAIVGSAKELLVTSRIARNVQIIGNPISQIEDTNIVVKRGDELRQQLLTQPTSPVVIPNITITDAEHALQAAWIALGPNNRIVLGPSDAGLVKPGTNTSGTVVVGIKPVKPRPQVFATGDKVEYKTIGNERVTIIHGAYLFRDTLDGKPPIEFHAQQMVLFSPPATAQPATTTAPAGTGELAGISRRVTGIYMEGDVTLATGTQTIRAEKIYYDFTSDRAIMLDAVLSAVDEQRNVPIYMRADDIRQLARGEYSAKNSKFSISEFYVPHYHIGASDAYLQDITPRDAEGVAEGPAGYEFKIKDATLRASGLPIFYWPYLSGDTNKNDIPLRRLRVGASNQYGLSIETKWDIFGLAGQREPKGLNADLNIDYFTKRGPAGGVDADWKFDDNNGFLKSYIMEDHGEDELGRIRPDLPPQDSTRGRFTARNTTQIDNEWTLTLQGSYISDPNFLQQFFLHEYNTDSEPETSFYLKRIRDTEAISLLGKWTLFDFTSSADQLDDQYTTNKAPEAKYWRIGDSILDMFTYYSESGASNNQMNFTNFTPNDLALHPPFVALPAAGAPANTTYRNYYTSKGWTDNSVLRGDTRQEIDMPLSIGDVKVTPYVTGRITAWDNAFPEGDSGSTVRVWGAGGVRAATQFWRVYDNVDSTFWDIHRIRHVIEPQFNIFVAGSDQDRRDLQPFDRDVEGMSTASGMQLLFAQKWQTKRGGPGKWRNVDWVVLNVAWNQFWNQDKTSTMNTNDPGFYPASPLRGFYMPSRPELSLVQNSIDVDGTWRVGERTRIIGEVNYSIDNSTIEQFATGVAVDQTDSLSYYIGNRYINSLGSDQWTFAVDYRLSSKYTVIAAESYDFYVHDNILTSLTLMRRMPRLNTAVTVTYDANTQDTSVIFTMWPEGFPEAGIGNRSIYTR